MTTGLKLLAVGAFISTLFGCNGGFQSKIVRLDLSSSAEGRPSVEITEPAAGSSTKGPVILKGNCTMGLSLQVSGDVVSPVQVSCSNGTFESALELAQTDGSKNISVKQMDPKTGLSGTSSRSFVRDTTAPFLQMIHPSGAASMIVRNSVVVQGSCENSLEVQLNDGTKTYAVPCNGGMFATTLTLTIPDGDLNLVVSQTDAVGNSASHTLALRKDTVAPAVSIASPAANATVGSSAKISGACESGLNVTISGAGAAAPATDTCMNGSYSIEVVFTAGVGGKAITAVQTDQAGNLGSAASSFNTVTVGPAIAILSPAADSTFKDTLVVSGTCEAGLQVRFSGVGWSAPATAPCASGTFSATITFTAGDGQKNLIVSQTNSANITGSSSRTFVRDTTAPVITIVSPAAGTVGITGITLAGACENGLSVKVSGAGAVASSVACGNGAYSAPVAFTAGDGNKVIQVTQTDSLGNSAFVSRTFVRDSTGPNLSITNPAVDKAGATGLTISGVCEGTNPVTAAGSGVAAPVVASCANSAFTVAVLFTGGDGTKTVDVSQADAVGNVGTASRNFKRVGSPVDGTIQTNAFTILSTNCKACHVDQALGGITNLLNLDHLLESQLITPGKPDESRIFVAINGDKMPPTGPLSAADKLMIRNWILQLGGEPILPPVPVDLTFDIKVPVEPITYRARLGKLSVLVGSTTAPSLNKVKTDRIFLGDYDFAKAIIPKFSWEATDLKAWMEAVDPICSSTEIRNRFPWPAAAANFLMTVAGRSPTSLDTTIIQEISALTIPSQEKFDVFCMTVLTSLEFVAK